MVSRVRRFEDEVRRLTRPIDCTCDGVPPLCANCCVSLALQLFKVHPGSLSISILKRRIPMLTGREASLLLEFTRRFD